MINLIFTTTIRTKVLYVVLFYSMNIMYSVAQTNLPAGGISVIDSSFLDAFKLQVNSGKAEARKVAIEGQLFKQAIELSTIESPKNLWDIQWLAPTQQPVEYNDVMLLSFYGRMVSTKDETGQSTVACTFEKEGPDYDKSLYRYVNFESTWKQYNIPFSMGGMYAAGKAQIGFQIGTAKQQVVQIAGLRIINYKKTIAQAALPKTEYTYKGREADAPWRKVAEANIEKYRKAEIQIVIKDKKGIPVPDALVEINMLKHSFGWGTAVDANTFLMNDTYRTNFYKHFNKMVFENDLKWPEWRNEYNRARTLQVLDTLKAKNIGIRGHCLVWPGWTWLPPDLRKFEKDPGALQVQITTHIQDEVATLGTKIDEWDVLNEPYTNTDVTRICGDQVMRDWFVETKKHTSSAKLYINDFSIFEGGGNDINHQDHYYKTIKYIKEGGAPIEGIGFQSHFAWSLTTPETIWRILDRYAEFNLDMQVTEFDIDVDDEQLQADYTRDFMTTIFAYPNMKGFVTWGFWAGKHWKPLGAMYRKDWSEKPNLKVWNDLVFKQWWTNASGKTDVAGIYSTRGFHGDYSYTIKNKSGKVISSGNFLLSEKGYFNTVIVK